MATPCSRSFIGPVRNTLGSGGSVTMGVENTEMNVGVVEVLKVCTMAWPTALADGPNTANTCSGPTSRL
ncbi:Uncharacterised protein [Bordetella pertussis]|nr:Uncharacterised protein [Bordetella pertussis]CFU07489.1 Uncharacterised protein [Bordetella pertussis]CFW32323.1 Uncharacterised protein [Bordetella pertussis]CPO82096.1 Uncharacterised protein [Bordetella pertussis]CRE31309.1 Uncharacterised protein [Bordetella pertussis]